MKIMTAAAALLALSLAPMTVQAKDDDILKHLVNSPNPASWIAYGNQTSKQIKDPTVQGGGAFEVQVTSPGPQPYTTAAQQDLTGPIKKGDKLIVVLWMKAAASATSPAPLHVRLQVNSGSYDGILDSDVNVTNSWDRYVVQGVSAADHPKGSSVLLVQLGQAKQTIDFGPAFVLDMGPDTGQ
jgi:hypothetical protein